MQAVKSFKAQQTRNSTTKETNFLNLGKAVLVLGSATFTRKHSSLPQGWQIFARFKNHYKL